MIRKLVIITATLLGFTLSCLCQEEQLVITPSSGKRILIFENPKGSIKVTGYDGNEIVVNAILRTREDLGSGDGEMKKIERNPLEITAETEGGIVTLYSRTTGKTADFDIKIPKNYSLRLKSLDNGNIQIININGEIEVENAFGDITLEGVSGSSVLNSVYGKITASFREVKPETPMMFTSFEGDISLNFPASLNALLKMKTGTGEINTDFDLVPVRRQSVVKNVENTKVYSLEDWITGMVNAGGPEYIIRSYNGNIIIKKQAIK